MAPHVVLLIAVWPALRVPRWAAAAGLLWLSLDIAGDILTWAGVAPELFREARYIGHLFAAAWIVSAALRGRGALRVVGLVLAVCLGGYTLVSAWLPPVVLALSDPLLVLWWILLGRELSRPGTSILGR